MTTSSITFTTPKEIQPGIWDFGCQQLTIGQTYRRGLGGRVLFTLLAVNVYGYDTPKISYTADGEENTDYSYLNSKKTQEFICSLIPSQVKETPLSLGLESRLAHFVPMSSLRDSLGDDLLEAIQAKARLSSHRCLTPGQPVIHRKELLAILNLVWGREVSLAVLNQVILQVASMLPQTELILDSSKRQFVWLPAAYRIIYFAKANPGWVDMLTNRAEVQQRESKRFNPKKVQPTLATLEVS